MEKNKYATNPIPCGRPTPDTFEYDDVGSSVQSLSSNEPFTNMAEKRGLVAVLLALVSNIVACVQVILAILTVVCTHQIYETAVRHSKTSCVVG